MQATYFKRSYTQLLSLLGLILVSLACQKALAIESSINIACIDSNDINTCSITGGGGASDELLNLAANLIKTASNISTPADPNCYFDSINNSVTCNLNDSFAQPINMTCTGANGTLSCSLDSAPTAFTIDCDSNSTPNNCTIALNTQPLTEKLTQGEVPYYGLNPNLISIANSLLSCINRNTFPGDSPGNVIVGIDEVTPSGSTNYTLQDICNQFIYDLENNPEEAITLLKELQPLNPDAPADLSTANLRLTLNTIQGRLYRLRNGIADASETKSNQFLVNNEWHQAGTLFADNANSVNDASQNVTVDRNISEYGKLGFFINASLLNADQSNDGLELKSNARSSVLTLGIDYRFTDTLIGGLAFNIDQSKTDFNGNFDTSGSLDNDGYSIMAYGSFYQDQWFFDSSLTFAGIDYEQQRDPASLGNSYKANFHGDQLSISGTGGYDFSISSFNITPFAQIVYGTINIDGYRETAVNALGPNAGAILELDSQSKDIGTLNIGSYFRYIANTQRGVFIPGLSLTLVNDFEDEAQIISGRFVANANPNSSFQLQTNKLDSTYFILGAGFSFQLKGGNAGFINLESVQGYDNLDQERITAGWRWEI
jgi:hypothetical protein